MDRILKYVNPLVSENVNKHFYRNISKYLDKDISAKSIRQRFLDYFIKECNHNFVRSSPVVPFYDPTVAFVNAGMNQFKGVFLGTQTPQYRKVANSQKCIRVGGKHNDLNVVGLDGYHHTYFEMLGNWSFGDYFKKDACQLAWDLLTQKYQIDEKILYITYFKGDDNLGLGPDLECKEIWRSIGVTEDRILPFGTKENFWEMGSTGPCGPCTEIHVDLLGTTDRGKFVNKGLSDLTELWNIVFIQYNRKPDGSLENLPQKHIDTGMGFERLTALLQGKISNFDTDIFSGILAGIQKSCKGLPVYGGKFGEKDWCNLDTNFRILADHARAIVVCLGDGVIPEQNQKLRRIIRKTFLISEMVFKKEFGLLKELSNYVVENLGSVYPELERNIKQIHQIIDYEEEVYRSIRNNSVIEWEKLVKINPKLSALDAIETPGLVAACKEINMLTPHIISPKFGFKLYDTFGLDENTITNLANILNLPFDASSFKKELEVAKFKSRDQALGIIDNTLVKHLSITNVQPTCDSYKYHYRKQNGLYIFDEIEVCLLKVILNNTFVENIKPDVEHMIIIDKTNLYTEVGGQSCDEGLIRFKDDCVFYVNALQNINGYILHKGILKSKNNKNIPLNWKGVMQINRERRLGNMRNHTATHLLNSVLKEVKGVTCQKSSVVNSNYLNFDVSTFGSKLSTEDIEQVEQKVNFLIKESNDVIVTNVDIQMLLAMDNVTLVPGEIYPSTMIRLIEINGQDEFQSREPCCGTHVLNTSDIQEFCIIKHKSLGRNTSSLYAVTGARANLARKNANELLQCISALERSVEDNMDKLEMLHMAVLNLKQTLDYDIEGLSILPAVIKRRCSERLNTITKRIKHITKNTLREFAEVEIQNVLSVIQNKTESKRKYIVHYLACSSMLETVSLRKVTDICKDLPVVIISYSNNIVKARCCVPKNLRNKDFDAEKWLRNTVNVIFNSTCQISKDQDSTLSCNMKGKKINIKDWDTLLKQSVEAANNYAEKYLI